MKKLTPPLKYHGGKVPLASWIISLMPPRCLNPNKPAKEDKGYLHFVEPYAGGLAVLLANDPNGISEVANDLNRELTGFWMVLQDQTGFNQLTRLLEAVPFSEVEYDEAAVNSVLEASGYGESVHRAATFFIRCRQSLAGRMDGFASITRNRTRRGMNEQVSAWLNAVEGLPVVHERLKRVLVLNRPALEVIRSEDGPRTLYYLDPPYLHETRTGTKEYGEHEMSDADHQNLLNALAGIEGRFLLSGYRSAMYDEAAEEHGWERHDLEVDNKAAGGKTKRVMVELIWRNYTT